MDGTYVILGNIGIAGVTPRRPPALRAGEFDSRPRQINVCRGLILMGSSRHMCESDTLGRFVRPSVLYVTLLKGYMNIGLCKS